MARELDLDEMRRILEPLRGYVGRKIQHVKSSGWYVVKSVQFREADMTPEFTYETLHNDPIAFSRPISELLDGRFKL